MKTSKHLLLKVIASIALISLSACEEPVTGGDSMPSQITEFPERIRWANCKCNFEHQSGVKLQFHKRTVRYWSGAVYSTYVTYTLEAGTAQEMVVVSNDQRTEDASKLRLLISSDMRTVKIVQNNGDRQTLNHVIDINDSLKNKLSVEQMLDCDDPHHEPPTFRFGKAHSRNTRRRQVEDSWEIVPDNLEELDGFYSTAWSFRYYTYGDVHHQNEYYHISLSNYDKLSYSSYDTPSCFYRRYQNKWSRRTDLLAGWTDSQTQYVIVSVSTEPYRTVDTFQLGGGGVYAFTLVGWTRYHVSSDGNIENPFRECMAQDLYLFRPLPTVDSCLYYNMLEEYPYDR